MDQFFTIAYIFGNLRWFLLNIWVIMTKIKLPKKPHSMVIFWIQLRRIYWDLGSQADPTRRNWIWSYPYFDKNRHFTSVQNTITHALSILTRFDPNFLENAWEFNRGVSYRTGLKWNISNSFFFFFFLHLLLKLWAESILIV